MTHYRRFRVAIEIIIITCVLLSCGIGIALGMALGSTRNIELSDQIGEAKLALPSQILDRNGDQIFEYFSEEKRNIVSIDELPKHLVYALVAAEDKNFFRHNGFDLAGLIRAAWNNLRGSYFSGASTITQQLATALYLDKTDITIKRKIQELWYAFQIEKRLSKYQILERYMNTIYLGHNTHGVEAASQFYFGHSARDITLAESAILIVQIRSPAKYSMLNHPNEARLRQKDVLDQMVELGYVTGEEAERSFNSFWDSYDITRSSTATAYFENESKAPYFTEYVRLQLEDILFGSVVDINREGLIIHTTLDLDVQETAQEIMSKGIHTINARYRTEKNLRQTETERRFLPTIEMLSLLFNVEEIRMAGIKQKNDAEVLFGEEINPVLDVLSLVFGSQPVRNVSFRAYDLAENQEKKTTVEGALITLDLESGRTGHILAMIGGSEFKTKKYNRAVDATVQPGSSFKPLFYSAAISSRKVSPATMINDSPVIFFNPDDSTYQPENYLGTWSGPVRLRTALARSMNVPSAKILDIIGFDPAIERASRLLGMYDQRNDEKLFPRKYPLALGVVSVAPINMARAFAVFPNQGREVEPLSIRYIEDRQGNIILNYEEELIRKRQRKSEKELQIMTPQEAYIMVSLLQSVVQEGTLMRRRIDIGGFDGMPMGGKTGTNTNWADAWTVGFSPYMATAVWFGFDLPGESLGRNQTGATAAGPIWAEYMKAVHKTLPVKEFVKPETGLITRTVCAISGKLMTDACDEGSIDEIFLIGTEPDTLCDVHPFEQERNEELLGRLKERLLLEKFSVQTIELPSLEDTIPELSLPGFDDAIEERRNQIEPEQEGNPLLD